MKGGVWQEWTVDATHSNVWNDSGKPELTKTRSGELGATSFMLEETLMPNSVSLVELNH
jgi:hypothetical protein